jgi:phosphoglucomutase
MTWRASVERWLSYPQLDAELKEQLLRMQNNEKN